MKTVDLKFVGKHVTEPQYATPGSAAVDLIADIASPINIQPGERKLIPTGLSIHIKDPTIMGVLAPRSGLGHKNGLVLGNGIGVLDSDYREQLMISAWNSSSVTFTVEPKMRLAQLMFVPITQVKFNIVTEHVESGRSGGFGSTGVK